jgi:WD40 repeat protein
MRLLKVGRRGELSLTEDFVHNIPPYAILSHTWGADKDEVTFDDMAEGPGKSKHGYTKMEFCGKQARKNGLEYLWVDTCCINKANHTELSEATWMRRYPITPAIWSSELQKLEGHTNPVSAVVFSHDSSLLASASDDATVRLWDPSTGQEVQKLEGHTDPVRAVAFSHDGSLLASASWDRTIRLWDPSMGQEVQKLEGHTGCVNAVAFSATTARCSVSSSRHCKNRSFTLVSHSDKSRLELRRTRSHLHERLNRT